VARVVGVKVCPPKIDTSGLLQIGLLVHTHTDACFRGLKGVKELTVLASESPFAREVLARGRRP
jgi:hypothetical protein